MRPLARHRDFEFWVEVPEVVVYHCVPLGTFAYQPAILLMLGWNSSSCAVFGRVTLGNFFFQSSYLEGVLTGLESVWGPGTHYSRTLNLGHSMSQYHSMRHRCGRHRDHLWDPGYLHIFRQKKELGKLVLVNSPGSIRAPATTEGTGQDGISSRTAKQDRESRWGI